EKIIYLADCSSADRNYWNVDDIRAIIRKDINKAMYEVLDFSVNDLTSKGMVVHPDTLKAYKEFNAFKY
ncbi:MAG: HD domain-containing protein, partial [Clostridia bacterium]|nr:HD domain-containing protein [Clostridia bacterium]